MKKRTLLILLPLLLATTAWADGPPALPFEGVPAGERETISADKAFGDPADFLAAAQAGADYLRYMQADITEDNAGNGPVAPDVDDDDLDDGGWDWAISAFEHSATASSNNLYGVTAQGLYKAYLLDPRPEWFIAMRDAADDIVAEGPTSIRSGPDVTFLCNFASLAECADPAYYEAGAQAIWDHQLATHGSMEDLAIYIRNLRYGQGYSNGLIPWDTAAWVEAAMAMHAVDNTAGHDDEADQIAEVLYEDSILGTPGYFDVYGANMGSTSDWSDPLYYYYTLGVAGLIDAFTEADARTEEIPGLQAVLLDCQYDDGAFSEQYGAITTVNDRSWQTSAYTLITLAKNLPASAATQDALYRGGQWLAATQDVSGAWVYSSGNHYPEVGGESTAALAWCWETAGAAVTASVTGPDPVQCGAFKTVTFSYDPAVGAPGLRGYEIMLSITGPVDFDDGDFEELGGLSSVGGTTVFYVVDQGGGLFSVNGSILGTTDGLQTAGDLFDLDLYTSGDGLVEITVDSFRMRDPDNADMFASMPELSFTVDCTAPPGVTDLSSAPGHQKVTLDWTMADASDVDHYEIWRALWHTGDDVTSAYPEYDDVNPAEPVWPADHAAADASGEWEMINNTVAGTATGYVDLHAPRGIYYYEVYAVDAVGYISPGAGPMNRSTNYWLGDIDPPAYDGDVDIQDMGELGATFGYVSTDGGYEAEADVGPTDDYSGVGIPATDNVIDFEDLMIFAMNYGNVSKRVPATGTSEAILAWTRINGTTWALELLEPCANLKGLRLRAPLPSGVTCEVSAGSLLGSQAGPAFVSNIDRNGFDTSVALMGRGATIVGAGELLRVSLDAGTAFEPTMTARGLDNEDLRISMTSDAADVMPTRFSAAPNYPNPFNPRTKIAFDLPDARPVRLVVYAIDGSSVRTLVDGTLPAGPHTVVWDGHDDAGQVVASGAYFYKLIAGDDSAVHKMMLMK